MKKSEYRIPARLLTTVMNALRHARPQGYGENGTEDYCHLAEMLYLVVQSQDDAQCPMTEAEVAQRRKLLEETRRWKAVTARG